MLTWAAQVVGDHTELLEQRHPTPIPVAERLPGPEDLNGILEECWWYEHACWYLDTYQANYTHWLPVNALPMPAND